MKLNDYLRSKNIICKNLDDLSKLQYMYLEKSIRALYPKFMCYDIPIGWGFAGYVELTEDEACRLWELTERYCNLRAFM